MTGPGFPLDILPANMQAKIQVQQDCWVWTGAKNRKGYGSVSDGKNGSMLAHRKAYTVAKGEIPEGLQIDHLCENTSCVNPAHLEPVTALVNMRRRYAKRTHCKRGHELAGDNLRIQVKPSDGGTRRICATFAREDMKAWRLKQKAQAH